MRSSWRFAVCTFGGCALIFCVPSAARATPITLSFEDADVGTVLADQYYALGIVFDRATVFDPATISNPPAGNEGQFILPSAGYNANGRFVLRFVDPTTGLGITTPFVTFTAYTGVFGDSSDSFDLSWSTSERSVGPTRFTFSGAQTFTIADAAGIRFLAFQDWGVNAFDNFHVDLAMTEHEPVPVPEPHTFALWGVAFAALATQRCLQGVTQRRKTGK